ncbi:hypothetical protein WA158_001955 [Blastocystis sp. Blastoise]
MKYILLLFIVVVANAIIIQVPIRDTLCLYDELSVSNKVDFRVEVLSGGEKDIQFTITSLGRDEVVYTKELGDRLLILPYLHEHDFEFPYFSEYKFCFDNTIGTKYPKMVKFELTNVESFSGWSAEDEKVEPIQESDVNRIASGVQDITKLANEIKGRQAAFKTQETERRSNLENVHTRVSFTSITEIVVFIIFAIVQVYVVKSWFQRKGILG